jgi:uncharacterized zinc-type alcohol dehydrogenase-like protein
MATTAEPHPTTTSGSHEQADQAKGWGTDAPTSRCGRWSSSAARFGPTTSRSRSPTPASATATSTPAATTGAGQRYPVIPGHEIVGTVTAIGDEVTRHRSATRSRSAAWSTAAWSATSASKAGKSSAARAASRPTTAPTITTARSARAATPTISSSATISCCKVPEGMDVSRVAPLAVRRHHDLLAAAPI